MLTGVFRTRVHPNVWLLLTILSCVHVANGCYYCDFEVYDNQVWGDFILKQPGVIIHRLKQIFNAANANIETIIERHGGAITPDTLSKLFTNFQTRFDILKNTSHAGNAVENFRLFMRECCEFLDTHMSDGLCPDNNCGLLYQLVKNCVSCERDLDSPLQIHNCSTPSHKLDCGQNYVQVEQGDEALLNCSLPRLMIPAWTTQYLYEWTPELNQSADSFTTLKATNESYMLLMNVSTEMQGTYRCSLTNHSSGTVFSRMTFLLNVTEPSEPDVTPTTQVPEGDVTPTATPPGGLDIVTIIIIVASVLTVACLGGVAIVLLIWWLRRRRRRRREKE